MQIHSIETGFGKVLPIEGRTEILRALKEIVTPSERVAANIDRIFEDDIGYFRFDVLRRMEKIKLDDWEDIGKIRFCLTYTII
jgi:hypothetical protein